MKFKHLFISLIIILSFKSYSISAAENSPQLTTQAQDWLQKFKRKLPSKQTMATWFNNIKNDTVSYIKSSLPKTKKEWALAIIGEGIAEGLLLYQGLSNLVVYKRDKAEDFIEKSKGIQELITGNLTE
jgi:hypothetical protein